jgi:hypothetical protein
VTNKFKHKQSGGNLLEILQRAQYKKKTKAQNEDEPVFDCSGGLHLSDTSDSEEESTERSQKTTKSKASSVMSGMIQTSSGTMVDLKAVHDNYQQMEKAKAQLSAYKKAGSSQKENLNIADLLAMGEGSSTSLSKKLPKVQKDDSDDDAWEEVEGKRIPRYLKILKKFEYQG